MKKLFLIKHQNGNITANFHYELEKPKYTVALAYQFSEQQKQMVSRLFDMKVYLKFGRTDKIEGKDSIQIFFPCEFSNIELEDVKTKFRDMFPVIITKEE